MINKEGRWPSRSGVPPKTITRFQVDTGAFLFKELEDENSNEV